MLSYALAVAATAASLLVSSANGCSCRTIQPTSLSDCEVPEGFAALLVTTHCVKKVSCKEFFFKSAAIADSVIDKVFKDNTDLALSAGDMVTVRSRTKSSCFGPAIAPGMQMVILSPSHRRLGEDDNDDDDDEIGEESYLSTILRRREIDDFFSDGSKCEINDADFDVGFCSPAIIDPTQAQINQIIHSCSTMTTGIPADLANPTPA